MIGLVLYTGDETRLMLNSRDPPQKVCQAGARKHWQRSIRACRLSKALGIVKIVGLKRYAFFHVLRGVYRCLEVCFLKCT